MLSSLNIESKKKSLDSRNEKDLEKKLLFLSLNLHIYGVTLLYVCVSGVSNKLLDFLLVKLLFQTSFLTLNSIQFSLFI